MNTRTLIILLSFLLAIAPVTSAYSSLIFAETEASQTSHCDQAPVQDTEPCCQNDQCNNNCLSLHCSHFGKLSALTYGQFETVSQIDSSVSLADPPGDPLKVCLSTPFRPPITML